MVTVAIIGILGSIAIPNFQNFTYRARQSEAKVALSTLYTGEQGYFAANGTFSMCIFKAGMISGTGGTGNAEFANNNYYNGGYSADYGQCGPNGAQTCMGVEYRPTTTATDCFGVWTTAWFNKIGGSYVTWGFPYDNYNYVDQNSFTVEAYGNVTNAVNHAPIDVWQINDKKTLINTTWVSACVGNCNH